MAKRLMLVTVCLWLIGVLVCGLTGCGDGNVVPPELRAFTVVTDADQVTVHFILALTVGDLPIDAAWVMIQPPAGAPVRVDLAYDAGDDEWVGQWTAGTDLSVPGSGHVATPHAVDTGGNEAVADVDRSLPFGTI